MKDTGSTIILVDFNQSTDTTEHFVNSRKESGRDFHLVSFADDISVEETKERLEHFSNKLELTPKSLVVKEGGLEENIEDVVAKIDATALVFTLNPEAKGGFFSSPRSLKLISSLNIVFVVLQHGAKIGPIQKIALPLELSSESKQKFEPALILAEDNQASLDVFLPKFNDEFQESAVSRNILWAERYLKDKNVDYTFNKATEQKHFEEQFIEFVNNGESDVIVILNYGDNFLSALFKSTEFKILQNKYKVPVMIMNYKATYRSKVPVLGQ